MSVLSLLLAASTWAGPSMNSPNSKMARDVVNSGGAESSSTSGGLVGSVAEEGIEINSASVSNKVKAGWSELHSFPGAVSAFTADEDASTSSATLKWTIPGYDGFLGALQAGSSYRVRVASYTAPHSFESIYADFVVSTSAPSNPFVGTGVTGLIANTTYFAQIWLLDSDGNLSPPSPQRSTFTTLALPVGLLPETFVNVTFSSAAVRWAARPSVLQDVSSMTSEGYLVEASSTNFGVLSPGGVVYSSRTPNVALSTLTIAVLPPLEHLCVDHYFRVASLNWNSARNYTLLGSTRAPDDYGVRVSTQDLDIGGVDLNTEIVISTSLRLANVACPVTYQLKVEALSPGTPWIVAASPAQDAFTVAARFNTVIPALEDYVAADILTTTPATSTPSKFAGDQNGVAVPVTEDRLIWFKLAMPTTTSTADPQQVRVTVYAIPP